MITIIPLRFMDFYKQNGVKGLQVSPTIQFREKAVAEAKINRLVDLKNVPPSSMRIREITRG